METIWCVMSLFKGIAFIMAIIIIFTACLLNTIRTKIYFVTLPFTSWDHFNFLYWFWLPGPECSKDGCRAIHKTNHYPVDSVVCFVNIYSLDSTWFLQWIKLSTLWTTGASIFGPVLLIFYNHFISTSYSVTIPSWISKKMQVYKSSEVLCKG